MTDTHFILKWTSKPLTCTSSFYGFFCIQFFPILFLYLLFLYFDLIDLCMLPLFVLCSGFSVASSRFSLESWLTILKMFIWLSRLRTLLLWKSASFQTLLAPDWSGFSRNSLGSELSKIFCSEDIFAFQTLSFFRSLNLCLSAMRCCPISLPIETILLFLRCSFLEFHPGGSFSCLILNVVFILFFQDLLSCFSGSFSCFYFRM